MDEIEYGGPGDADDEGITCPMPCAWCEGQSEGACEDCLDCLFWPRPVLIEHREPPARVGPRSPVLSDVLSSARAEITLAQRIGLVLRSHRRKRRRSQRDIAQELGWSRSAVARAEVDAANLPLHKIEALLSLTVHRIAIVPDTGETAHELGEDDDTAWGVPDLVARDAGRRRLPPIGTVRFRPATERWVDSRCVGHESPWVWRRP